MQEESQEEFQEEFHRDSKKSKLRELILFLAIVYISMALPCVLFCPETCSFPTTVLVTILRNLGLSALVFLFLKLRGESPSHIGWTSKDLTRHVVWAVIIFPIFYFSVGVVLDFFTRLGLSHITDVPLSLMPEGPGEIFLGALLVLVVALAEEIIFRGYLLTRLTEITGGTRISVFLSTLIFALGHAYEGTAGMMAVAYIGLVFCLLFLWEKSLTMVIVLHFLTNFIPIVVAPLLGGFN